MVGRLTVAILKIVKTDAINARGLQTVKYSALSLMKNFEIKLSQKSLNNKTTQKSIKESLKTLLKQGIKKQIIHIKKRDFTYNM